MIRKRQKRQKNQSKGKISLYIEEIWSVFHEDENDRAACVNRKDIDLVMIAYGIPA